MGRIFTATKQDMSSQAGALMKFVASATGQKFGDINEIKLPQVHVHGDIYEMTEKVKDNKGETKKIVKLKQTFVHSRYSERIWE